MSAGQSAIHAVLTDAAVTIVGVGVVNLVWSVLADGRGLQDCLQGSLLVDSTSVLCRRVVPDGAFG